MRVKLQKADDSQIRGWITPQELEVHVLYIRSRRCFIKSFGLEFSQYFPKRLAIPQSGSPGDPSHGVTLLASLENMILRTQRPFGRLQVYVNFEFCTCESSETTIVAFLQWPCKTSGFSEKQNGS